MTILIHSYIIIHDSTKVSMENITLWFLPLTMWYGSHPKSIGIYIKSENACSQSKHKQLAPTGWTIATGENLLDILILLTKDVNYLLI